VQGRIAAGLWYISIVAVTAFVGAALVAALLAAATGSAGGHKARPYAMHFRQIC